MAALAFGPEQQSIKGSKMLRRTILNRKIPEHGRVWRRKDVDDVGHCSYQEKVKQMRTEQPLEVRARAFCHVVVPTDVEVSRRGENREAIQLNEPNCRVCGVP